MTNDEAISHLATVMADAEDMAGKIRASMRSAETSAAWNSLRDNGVIGGLEMQERSRGLDALVTKFEADLFAYHSELTARAKELSVDLPQPRGGGGR